MSDYEVVGDDQLGYQTMSDSSDSSMIFLDNICFAPVGADGTCGIDDEELKNGLQERIHEAVRKPYAAINALMRLIETIEATGGLDCDGYPLGDPEWVDLGDAYLDACAVIERTPMQEERTHKDD